MNTATTKKVVLGAVFCALILISTMFAIPSGFGYINLGDGFILTSGAILGPYWGMISGAIGAGMADMILGYNQYIIPTIILKGFMGFLGGYAITSKKNGFACYIIAGLTMVGGYYLTDSILYNNFITPLSTIPFNVLQFTVGVIICRLIYPRISKLVNLK